MDNLKKEMKKKKNSKVASIKKSVSIFLVFLMAIFNLPVLTAKASTDITFDYETGIITGFGTKTVSQNYGGEILIATSTSQNLIRNSDFDPDLVGESLATDYGTASETSITFSLQSGKVFDLSSMNFGDYSGTNEVIRITSSKGYMDTGAITNINTTFNVSGQSNAAYFKGITYFTITAASLDVGDVVKDIDGMAFDKIALTNIITPAASSNDATLNALNLSSGTLSPTFASGTTAYTASVANTASSMTVTPTVNESHATVTVNGTPVTSGNASGSISLSVGSSNTITVQVTAQDTTTTKTYTITVTRAAPPSSNDATLNSLNLSSGTLSPTFASGTIAYTASVANGVSIMIGKPLI